MTPPIQLARISNLDNLINTPSHNHREHSINGSVKYVQLKKVKLAYETFGDAQHPTVLLVMGLGAQMLVWPDSLCELLARQGFYVIRFDNRDIGLSTKLTDSSPKVVSSFLKKKMGLKFDAPYSLHEMAEDCIELLMKLERPNAHIVGASMGGMIAQLVAAKVPELTSSLSIVMSASGYFGIPSVNSKLLLSLLQKGSALNDCHHKRVEHKVKLIQSIGSISYPSCKHELKHRLDKVLLRSSDDSLGTRRQCMAVMATGALFDIQKSINADTLVIHGDEDRLISLKKGVEVANRIPGAKFELVSGMGHDFPAPLIARVGRLLSSHMISNSNF